MLRSSAICRSAIVPPVSIAAGTSMAGTEAAFDGRSFRNTLSQFCTGVVVATGVLDGQPAGIRRAVVHVAVARPAAGRRVPEQNEHELAETARARAASASTCCRRSRRSCAISSQSRGSSPTSRWRPGVTGSPVLDGVIAYIDCDLEAEHDAGDHIIAVGRVRDLQILDARRRAAAVLPRRVRPIRDVH